MINIPKGTKDVLPADSFKWQYVETAAREVCAAFNLKEIRTPIFEHTELFLRGVGDTTDIVSKEMYTFLDKGGRSITLKPEGTAGVARSFIENSLQARVLPVKMYYFTPVFRYERPQAGRLRQHHQFGVEVFGSKDALADAEVILTAHTLFKNLKISGLTLNINSIGCKNCRPSYNLQLKNYLSSRLGDMCAVCKDRYEKNPLRILDCKEKACAAINQGAPKITDYLCGECGGHFESLKTFLALAGIEYTVNPYIVRGLDYYSKTVFEFVSQNIGAQGTVCGGGRYDTLIENLGGAPSHCVGFGLGLERLLLVMESAGAEILPPKPVSVYFASIGEKAREKAFELAYALRQNGISAELDHMSRGVKPQFKYADRINAKFVATIGESELETNNISVKNMQTGEAVSLPFGELLSFFK